jgi:hypothetical protein
MNQLKEINNIYRSDKGFGHNYIDFYESIFSPLKEKKLNILEIGVLFGNSLKLWNDYFINSKIYGIDDFSQPDGHQYYNFKPIVAKEVEEDLRIFERIKLLVFDCTDKIEIEENLKSLKFDIIIDDANHDLSQQKTNYSNYNQFLNEDGLYICEDIGSTQNAVELEYYIRNISPEKNVTIHEFNTEFRADDRILLVKRKN